MSGSPTPRKTANGRHRRDASALRSHLPIWSVLGSGTREACLPGPDDLQEEATTLLASERYEARHEAEKDCRDRGRGHAGVTERELAENRADEECQPRAGSLALAACWMRGLSRTGPCLHAGVDGGRASRLVLYGRRPRPSIPSAAAEGVTRRVCHQLHGSDQRGLRGLRHTGSVRGDWLASRVGRDSW